MANKVTKYLVRNVNGSILGKFDDDVTARDFFKKHVAAVLVEKVTVISEIVEKKRSKSEMIVKVADMLSADAWI